MAIAMFAKPEIVKFSQPQFGTEKLENNIFDTDSWKKRFKCIEKLLKPQ